jgi:hypothetical protein
MDATNPPTRPPTSAELLNDPTVQQALEQAWIDSQPNDPAARHEEGGWIYMDTTTGRITIRRSIPGGKAELDLGAPPVIHGSIIVGIFHTHPNPMSEGWDPGPSKDDRLVHDRLGLPGLIRADDGVHTVGPVSRRSGLT